MMLRKAAAVSSGIPIEETYKPGDGEKLNITQFISSPCHCGSIKIEITWNDVLIFVAHSTMVEEYIRGGSNASLMELVGDGNKELKIKLINDSDVTETLMGCVRWE